jgi:hypothetical protein
MSDKKKGDESIEHALARPSDDEGMIVIPDELPVLTLRNTVLFPGSIVPLGIGRTKTVRLVEETIKENALVAVVAQRDPDVDDPNPTSRWWCRASAGSASPTTPRRARTTGPASAPSTTSP